MNQDSHRSQTTGRRRSGLALLFLAGVIVLSLACNQPFAGPRATPPVGTPGRLAADPVDKGLAAVQTDLPPVVVETDPLPSAAFPLAGPLTLHFSQPMEKSSVEKALKVEPAVDGRFEWAGDSVVRFFPEQAFQPGESVHFTVETSARGTNGRSLLRPADLLYQTPGDFRVIERLPEPNIDSLDPSAAVAVTFNQPAVPLGEESETWPAAFSLEPATDGRGEWLNTSTYVFYGEPALRGGVTYTVQMNPELTSTGGVPLETGETEWTFTTALPRLLRIEPDGKLDARLDTPFTLTFNQPMDRATVEAAFGLVDSEGRLAAGSFQWSESDTVLTFQPDDLLDRSGLYTLRLSEGAQGLGGAPIDAPFAMAVTGMPDLAIIGTEPAVELGLNVSGGYGFLTVLLSAPLRPDQDFDRLVSIQPEPPDVSVSLAYERDRIYVNGAFSPSTAYTVRFSPELTDEWGGRLAVAVEVPVRTLPANPSFAIPILQVGANTVFVPAGESTLPAQVTNISRLEVAFRPAEIGEYLASLNDYAAIPAVDTAGGWTQSLSIPPDQITPVEIALTGDGQPLAPGFYAYRMQTPEEPLSSERNPFFVVVSRFQLALKVSSDAVSVWAVDLADNRSEAGRPLSAFDAAGNLLGEGVTDVNGLAQIELPAGWLPSDPLVVVSGQPGDADFAFGSSVWNQGLASWDFGLLSNFWEPEEEIYVYTDRPIYRPGQTVYFRLVGVRPAAGGYRPMAEEPLKVHLQGTYSPVTGQVPLIDSVDLALSPLGTAHGAFVLPEDASTGQYVLLVDEYPSSSTPIHVADYRKPEIDLSVAFSDTDFFAGADLSAEITASTFFGSPAAGAPVHWRLYARQETLDLPGRMQMGRQNLDIFPAPWMNPWWEPGRMLLEGQAVTGPDGQVELTIPAGDLAPVLPDLSLQQLTLEATLADESQQQVSGRAEARLFAGEHLIGVEPETWSARAGEQAGFSIQTFDWQVSPAGDLPLQAVFERVVWKQNWVNWQMGQMHYEPEYTPAGSTDLVTGPDGRARVAFTPESPGTYRLTVQGAGAATEVMVWVAGEGTAVWPDLANQHLQLEAERTDYAPGETASIFIPNPFGAGAAAWITVERDQVMRSQVIRIDAASYELNLSLGEEDAPNVYVSIMLIGRNADGRPDFRVGYQELEVDPVQQTLQVDLQAEPQTAGPGDRVQFLLQARDAQGNPVQAEFSLAVVDQAVFALRDPNVSPIDTALYGQRPLRVSSSLSLAVYAGRISMPPLGGGGGGGDAAPFPQVRTDFQDTAFWTAALMTGEDGTAAVEVTLPDNLTTWVALARGLDEETRVGEAEVEVIVSKPLVIRPAIPRYFVAGDRVRLAAIAHNNTDQALTVQVSLQAGGFELAAGQPTEQRVEIPAGGQQVVYWQGQVADVDGVDLRFEARAGSLTDAVIPEGGRLPVLRYDAPHTFATTGILPEGGEELEVVSLPRSYTAESGRLQVELNATLAGVVIAGLDVQKGVPYDYTEPVISRLLPNLQVKLALQRLELAEGDLQARVDQAIQPNLEWLLQHQNADGGWGWAPNCPSSAYLSAYGLLALTRARQAGETVDPASLSTAQNYLLATLISPEMASEDWQLNRLAFIHFVLAESGLTNVPPAALYPFKDRLSPWAKAFLAVSLSAGESGSEQVQTLLAELETSAVRSAGSAHWDADAKDWMNFADPLFSTSAVTYALAKADPASPLLADAVRYLVAHYRPDGMGGSYGTSWSLLALTEYMEGTGELQARYDFAARLNDVEIASGTANGLTTIEPVRAEVEISELNADQPNGLVISRTDGAGRLYYRADLQVSRPVETITPLERGLAIQREYFLASEDCRPGECTPVDRVSLGEDNPVILVRLTLTLPADMHYLMVADIAPAGAEIVNPALNTFQTFEEDVPQIDPRDPFGGGWGWWYFSPPAYTADRVTWLAEHVPAGTYQLVYRLLPQQAGEFHALPARAWQSYFPEVQGTSSGAVLTIEE